MNKYIYLFVILILLVSCHNKTETKSDIPSITLEGLWDSNDFVNLSEVAESIEYIPLEKTPECILPGENMLGGKICGDIIIIRFQDHPLNVFNRRGEYMFNIGNYGKGPGEYISAKVEYDQINSLYWILDPSQHKILKYDKSGSFLDEFKTEQYVCRIALNADGKLYALKLPHRRQFEDAEVQIFGHEGKIESRIPLYQDREPGAGAFFAIAVFFEFINDTLHFNEAPFRIGYKLDGSRWIESWKIDQGKNSIPDQDYYDSGTFAKGPAVASVLETDNYLFIGGFYENYSKRFVLDKTTKSIKTNTIIAETELTRDMWGMFNDIDGGLPFWPNGYSSSNEYIQLNDALRYIELGQGHLKYYGTDKKVPVSDELKSLCKKLDPDDNPVAMVVRLKAQGSRLKAQGSGLRAQVGVK